MRQAAQKMRLEGYGRAHEDMESVATYEIMVSIEEVRHLMRLMNETWEGQLE
jgi:hypothetical protein